VVYGVLLALVALSVAGLLSRTLPEVFPVSPGPGDDERLNFPLTYWNAVGIVGSLATVLCLGLTGSRTEHRFVRIATAAAVPALVATVYFTFSRGSIAAALVGIAATVVLAPRRHLIPGFVATLPPAAVAVIAAWQADALAREHPTGPDAVSQGRTTILVIAAAVVAAAVLRALLVRFVDERMDHQAPLGRRPTLAIGAGVVVVAVAAALLAGAPGRIDHAYDRFVHGERIDVKDLRDRLTDPGNNGRLAHWRVAMDAYRSDKLKGAGAGTYQVWWNERRDRQFDVVNAHSLYAEVLGESGIVGIVLLAAALLALLAGVLARLRGPDRALWATVAGAMLAWLIEAGADWIWQMPATAFWLFVLGGAALARPATAEAAPVARSSLSSGLRLVAGVAALFVALTPVRVALSQGHLEDAIAALKAGDCRGTVSAALDSASAVGARGEPYELLAYCDVRLGQGPLALEMIDRAIARDPRNWEYRFDRALVLAAQGRDPRPDIAAAERLNPLEPQVYDLGQAMDTESPEKWRRRALRTRLLLPGS
jgi:hypothetical protein